MRKTFLWCMLIAAVVVSVALTGCKAKTEKAPEPPQTEVTENMPPIEEAMNIETPPVTEPAQTVAAEAIPPTAAAQPVVEKAATVSSEKQDRNRDIQRALKKAGFYSGMIDGKIGPKTKKSIVDFQKAKGLKPDGKVGVKTWTELEKYLIQ